MQLLHYSFATFPVYTVLVYSNELDCRKDCKPFDQVRPEGFMKRHRVVNVIIDLLHIMCGYDII